MKQDDSFKGYYSPKDLDLRNELFDSYKSDIINTVNRVYSALQGTLVNLNKEDLPQDGYLTLLDSIDSYKSKIGSIYFSTYLQIRLKRTLLRNIYKFYDIKYDS